MHLLQGNYSTRYECVNDIGLVVKLLVICIQCPEFISSSVLKEGSYPGHQSPQNLRNDSSSIRKMLIRPTNLVPLECLQLTFHGRGVKKPSIVIAISPTTEIPIFKMFALFF